MISNELDNLIAVFSETSDNWTQQLISLSQKTADLQYRNADRGFNLVLALSSISVAFLTVVAPTIQIGHSRVLILTVVFFILTTLCGIVILAMVIERDKKSILSDDKWERELLVKFQQGAISICNKLSAIKRKQDQKLDKEIISEIENYFAQKDELKAAVKERQEAKNRQLDFKILKSLNIFFVISFIIAIILLSWGYLELNM